MGSSLFREEQNYFGQRSTNSSTSGHPGWDVSCKERGKCIRNEEPALQSIGNFNLFRQNGSN